MFRFLSAAIAVFLIGFAVPAFAGTVVDFGPVIDLAFNFFVAVFTALVPVAGAWIALRLNKSLGLSIDAKQREVIEQGLSRAIGFGLEQARAHLPNASAVDVKSVAVAQAVTYAQAFIPGALSHFGITPDKLAQMVAARFTVATASTPAVVPAPVATPAPVAAS